MSSETPIAQETKKSIYKEFNLKSGNNNTVPSSSSKNDPPQGRPYSTAYAKQPSGIRVDDMIYGIKMAHLSCTDDSEGRLQSSGCNTVQALCHIVGDNETEARQPLSTILKTHFDLTMDCWMDESGVRYGRAVDTQGFIASNDHTIVLSYRFSTTGLDWLTNLSMTSSEWEPDRDELIGHAGLCSCLDGLWTRWFTDRGKPRVHTGFYNNFVYTIPMIRQHILEKLLQRKTGPPVTVYICGCSLGAALATLAFCFVLQNLPLEDPDFPHKVINVTAGSPRVCDRLMKKTIMDRMKLLRPMDKAVLCRLVYNHDLVPHIPIHLSGFVHLEKMVYITPGPDSLVIINPKLESHTKNFAEVKAIFDSFWTENGKNETAKVGPEVASGDKKREGGDEDAEKTPFELECEQTPGPIRDHMPYWYLTCLEELKARIGPESA